MIVSRFVIPAIGATAMVLGLGHVMIKLIHVEFEAEPEKEVVLFETEVIETPPIRFIETVEPVRAKNVDIPPRVDLISNDEPDGPPLVITTGPVKPVKFPKPNVDIDPIDSGGIDKEAKPIRRVGAKVPNKALRDGRSGHCLMRFDVDSLGKPFNVTAYHCSHTMFQANSVEATKKFKYLPKYRGGEPVEMIGVETKIIYQVLDENGQLLSES